MFMRSVLSIKLKHLLLLNIFMKKKFVRSEKAQIWYFHCKCDCKSPEGVFEIINYSWCSILVINISVVRNTLTIFEYIPNCSIYYCHFHQILFLTKYRKKTMNLSDKIILLDTNLLFIQKVALITMNYENLWIDFGCNSRKDM